MREPLRLLCLIFVVNLLCDCPALGQEAPQECGTKPIPDLKGRLPVPDYLDAYRGCANGMPPIESQRSAWLAADQEQYSELLARTKSSWLVLPAQSQFYGFDRIERGLIGAVIAEAFADQGSMPDTFLVARALGEVRRRYDVSVAKLTADLGAVRRVSAYVGHDGRKRMTLTIQLEDCSNPVACKLIKQQDWRGLAFTDELPPFLVVQGLQAEIRRQFLGKNARPSATQTSARALSGLTPSDLASTEFVPGAHAYSLLAALAPGDDELTRHRLSSGALRAWLRMPVNGESRFFAAYAAMDLERRPFAIAQLGDSRDPSAQTLRALLDGNLPEARQNIGAVKIPLQRLLLEFKTQDLARIYGRKVEFDASAARNVFGTAFPEWEPFVARRAGDLDAWYAAKPAYIKLLLDAIAPVDALSLRNVVVGGAVVGGFGAEVSIANFRHLRRPLPGFDAGSCCFEERRGAAAWPMFWLLEGLAEADVLKQISHFNSTQGLPERALAFADAFEPYLGGKPEFELSRAYVLGAHIRRARNEDALRFSARYDQAEALAAFWSQGQTRTSRAAVFRTSEHVRLAVIYSKDFPMRSYWPGMVYGFGRGEDPNTCTALKYSTHDIEAAVNCLSRVPRDARAAVLEQLGKRFRGNPENVRLAGLASPPAAGSSQTDETDRLRAAIKDDPESWGNYRDLGELLLRKARYAEAQRVYQSYPGFKGRSAANRVALSNHAYEAGSELFWRGEVLLARPLYELAANLGTGSSASLTSAARLAQLDGDFESAAAIFHDRATRYASPYAFRDFLSLLHVMGHSEEARSGFLQVADRFPTPQVWVAPLVDQRMSRMTYEQMKSWVLKEEIRTSRYRGRRFAPYFATMWVTTDRKPPPDFPRLMAEIEHDAVRTTDSGRVLRPSTKIERMNEFVSGSPFRAGKAPSLPPDTRVKSEYVLLAEALTAMHAGQHAAAVDKFIELADLYPIESGETQVALAYFALAAAKTGDKQGLEQYIESLDSKDTDFDAELARAFFSAVRRRSDAAASALTRAFNARPHSELRAVPTEYQYAEACEIVARETGDPQFIDRLLVWVRQHQQLQPTQAWAYAMEAQYSKNAEQANRALAITMYLDPSSPRIAALDQRRRDAAAAWLRLNNPFLRQKGNRAEPIALAH